MGSNPWTRRRLVVFGGLRRTSAVCQLSKRLRTQALTPAHRYIRVRVGSGAVRYTSIKQRINFKSRPMAMKIVLLCSEFFRVE